MNEHIYSLNLNLEKILAREKIVLVDSSFFSVEWNLAEAAYDIKSYKDFDKRKLKKVIEKLEGHIKLLEHPKIKMLPENITELQRFQQIVSEKASFLGNRYRCWNKKNKPGTFVDYTGVKTEVNEKKELFEELCLLVLKRTKVARPYKPNTQDYTSLCEIIRKITEAEKLKGPKRIPRWYKPKPRNEPENNYTDEKIIAALLESTLNEPVAVITKDYHLRLILEEVCELLLCRELWPYNKK